MSSRLLTLLRRRAEAAAPAAFSPDDDPPSPLALWLSARNASTITNPDDAGVSQWDDVRGNGKFAYQNNFSSQPFYFDSELLNPNDLTKYNPGLTFDGSDDFMIAENVGAGTTPEVVAVLSCHAPLNNQGVGFVGTNGASNAARAFNAYGTYGASSNLAKTLRTIDLIGMPQAELTYALEDVVVVGNYLNRGGGADASLFWAAVNGDAYQEDPYTYGSDDGVVASLDYVNIGRYPGSGLYLNHTLSELLIFAGPLTPTYRTALIAYLRNAYANAFGV